MTISELFRRKYLDASPAEQDQAMIITATDEDFHACYIMNNVAGDGTSAVVHFATDVRNGRKVAVKVIQKNGLDRESAARIANELTAWRKVRHPHICQLYEVFNTPSCYYLVCEAAENGDLLEFINNHGFFKEKQARRIFLQLISAIDHCHSLGIVHRDLKLENILLDKDSNIKLTDFGFAGFFETDSDNRLHEWCGSPPYAAPEIFLGRPYIGPEIDIWSLGVVLFSVCSGTLPFHGESFDVLMKQVVQARFEIPFFMSMSCESLIRNMLELNPDKRTTLSAIHKHSWVTAVDNGKPNGRLQKQDTTSDSSPSSTTNSSPAQETPQKDSADKQPSQRRQLFLEKDLDGSHDSGIDSQSQQAHYQSTTIVSSDLLLFTCPKCSKPNSAKWDFESRKESVCVGCERQSLITEVVAEHEATDV